jgi:LuxR family maltose regulon positive regulatory protein
VGETGEHGAGRPSPHAAVTALRDRQGLLVESKLYAPGVRPEWVPRQRLVRHLTATEAKLVLVEAPAGFGKTILAAQWRSAVAGDRPFAWVSLDRSDDDPGRLWWHVVTGLQRACPGFAGPDPLRLLRTQVPDVTGELLPRLVNGLAGIPQPVTLVLDDYHMLGEPRCHEQIEFLLFHLVAPAQVVILTRTDPPLPLARLRAAGDLAEIGMRQLCLTRDEAAALVGRVAGVELSEDDLASLVERTEGWPAGVYLIALALRGHHDPGAFVRRFSGNNAYIAGYLFEEVISRQPGRVRRFLTRTAILRRFTAPLCEAVTETADAAGIIDMLTRDNLFLVPLDDRWQWFRYHHLFREVLGRELERGEPEFVPALHRRASAWLAAHGPAEEAIDHALAGGDLAGAAGLIAGAWAGFANAGRMQTVRGWVAALGDDLVTAYPLAAHVAAWVAALSGEPETVRRLLPVIDAGQHAGRLPDGMRSLQFSAALLRGQFGFDGIRIMRESAARAVELEDPASPWYPLALVALGFSRYLSREPGAAEPLSRAVACETADPLVRLAALAAATLAAADESRPEQVKAHANAARRLADGAGLSGSPQMTLAYIAAGVDHAQEGRLAQARGEFERALRSRRRWLGLSPWPTFENMLRLASVLLDLGDRAAAAPLLAEAGEILAALPDGAGAQRARLQSLLRRLRLPSGPAAQAGPLTERETAVLRLLPRPLSVREIGRELHVSRNTVKSHLRAIYRKLGVTTRDEAVARGREVGYV